MEQENPVVRFVILLLRISRRPSDVRPRGWSARRQERDHVLYGGVGGFDLAGSRPGTSQRVRPDRRPSWNRYLHSM